MGSPQQIAGIYEVLSKLIVFAWFPKIGCRFWRGPIATVPMVLQKEARKRDGRRKEKEREKEKGKERKMIGKRKRKGKEEERKRKGREKEKDWEDE